MIESRIYSTECIKHEKAYSMIFMDIAMPVMDGFLATEGLRKLEELNLEPHE